MRFPGRALRHRHAWPVAMAVFLIGAAFLAFGSTIGHGFVDFDDGLLIYRNPLVQHGNLSTVWRAFTSYDPELYIPLTLLSFQVDWLLGGGSPAPFHITNVLLHALNAWLVYLLFVRLVKHRGAAFACALLFAVHPLHTEAVVWASARKDLLSTAFGLGSMLLYLRWRATRDIESYAASVGCFLLGLLAKVSVITVAPILVLLDWREGKRDLRAVMPHFVLAIVFALIAFGGKATPLAAADPMTLALLAVRSVPFLLMKFVFPVHLSPLYPAPDVSIGDPMTLLSLAIVGLVIFGALWASHRHRDVGVGIWFALIALAPSVLNAAKGGHVYLTTDRYAYLPSVGLLFLLALSLRHLCTERGVFSEKKTTMIVGWSVAVAAVLIPVSMRQAAVWKNSITLFTHAVLEDPDFALSHYFLGNAFRNAGQIDLAIEAYRASLLRDANDARTHAHLAHAYAEKSMLREAAEEYGRALSLDPKRADAHFGLGVVYGRWKQNGDAASEYRAALALQPDYPDASLNLGALLGERGDLEGEVAVYLEAIAANPDHALLHHNLGVALEQMQRIDEAVVAYKTAMRLQPDLPFPREALERLERIK